MRSLICWTIFGSLVVVDYSVVSYRGGPHHAVGSYNSRNASGSLKQFGSVEVTFMTSDSDQNGVNDYWTGDVAGLYYLQPPQGTVGIKMIEMAVAEADRFPDAYAFRGPSSPKAGYWFKSLWVPGSRNGRNPNHFAFCAYPAQYGKSGVLTFIINEQEIMWKKDLRGFTIDAWPADPQAEGWRKMD